MTIRRKTKERKITGEEGTMRFGSGIPSRMGAMWCRPSSVGDISQPCGSLGILKNPYVSTPLLFRRREKVGKEGKKKEKILDLYVFLNVLFF